MRALVTGGAGFIGSHLVELLLSKGWDVLVVDNLSTGRREWVPEGAELVPRDILSALPSLPRVDVAFHLAAEATVSCSPRCWHNNVSTTYALGRWAKERGIAVIYASSAAVYGGCNPCREHTPLRPANLYGATKAAGELILRALGVRHAILRPFNVYGERMNPAYGAVVLAFTKAMLSGKQPVIFGDGKAVRDYIYVKDVAKAFLSAWERLDRVEGKAVNVGTGQATSVEELFHLLKGIVGYGGEPLYGPPRPGDVEESVASTDLLKELLPLESLTPLKKGLERVVAYYRDINPSRE